MACPTCGKSVLFGGVKDGNKKYCSKRCYESDEINRIAAQIPNEHVEQLANDSHVGYSHFRRMFKKYTGLSPAQYHLKLRLQKARELLLTTNLSVKQIAYELGFQSNYYFTRIFTQKMGDTPTGLRKN